MAKLDSESIKIINWAHSSHNKKPPSLTSQARSLLIKLSKRCYSILGHLADKLQIEEVAGRAYTAKDCQEYRCDTDFSSPDIEQWIRQKVDRIHIYQARYRSQVADTIQEYSCRLIVMFDTKITSLKEVGSLVTRLLRRTFLMLVLSGRDLSQEVKIVIWLSPISKELPATVLEPIGAQSVNSGASWYPPDQKIYLWRQQEILKVLIHELIHYLELDMGAVADSPALSQWLYQHTAIANPSPINPNESYVEVWACLLNCILTSLPTKLRAPFSSTSFKKLFTFLTWEQQFSQFQAAKLLHHFDFTSWRSFYFPRGIAAGQSHHLRKFQQTTSALSYYIVKAALLWNVSDFLQFCKGSSSAASATQLLQFQPSQLDRYQLLIKQQFGIASWESGIDNYLSRLTAYQGRSHNRSSWMGSTMRMTAVQPKLSLRLSPTRRKRRFRRHTKKMV